ncbi:MAG: insulinase family protein [Bdellovibrio sp.]|nr:MAG: insulinase family protein [Bdellovibrio sp.]
MAGKFNKTVFSNGVRVVSEHHQQSHSIALGLWVLTGTRDEPEHCEGITHFLEHLVFKGTKTRSAYEIVRSLEELGGEVNAFTTREYTCFHATVLSQDWEIALDVLADLVSQMKVNRKDFEVERSVVLQEIDMSEDEHEDLAYDVFLRQFLGSHPLGRPILGTAQSLASLRLPMVKEYYRRHYTGRRLILSAAGNLQADELVKRAEKLLGRTKNYPRSRQEKRPRPRPFMAAVDKNAEQLHLLMGFPATSFKDKRRFEAFLANNLLGGGMTSRLYQAVREKKGLTYSVYSSLHSFTDFGMLNILASAQPQKMPDVVKSIFSVIDKVKRRGLSRSELKLFQRQLEGNLRLGAEDMESRMNSLAVNEMIFQEYRPVERVIEEIHRVTPHSLKNFLEEYLDFQQAGILFLGSQAEQALNWFSGHPTSKPFRQARKAVL